MNRSRKYILFLLCVVLMIGTFSGCHGAKGMNAFVPPDHFDTSREYDITFWAKNDTNKAQTDIYHQAISDFQKFYPNIHVNIRLYTDYGKIYNDVITNIATGTTPNVCITYPDHIATYLTGRNSVVPLDTLFSQPAYGLGADALPFDSPEADEILPRFLEECTFSGHCYALPYMRSTEACYINKTYVEKLGYEVPDILTWDYIWEVSEDALEKNTDGTYLVNGQRILIPFIYKSTDNMMIQMLRQLNAGYSSPSGEIALFHDSTLEIMHTVAEHVKSGAFSTFKISSYPANFLNAGQCLFAVDSTAGSTWMGAHAPLADISPEQFVEFETAVRPVPQYDPNDLQMISQGPSICVFNQEDSQEVVASWLFAQYLLTNQVQIPYSQTEGYLPVTSKAHQSEEYQEYLSMAGADDSKYYDIKISASKLLLEHTEDTFVTPVFNGSASLRNAAGQLIENTAKAVRRNQPTDRQGMNQICQDVRSLYHLDQIQTLSRETDDFGPMPAPSILLLSGLCLTWIAIIIYSVKAYYKNRKSKNSEKQD